MKMIITGLRIAVGVLFIFSGLVKANDPMGLAYKMEEYFEGWKLFWMISYAKPLSIGMNALEIISGFALLIGWQNKWNLRLLFALILFFTALTGYTYYTGYPKTCGCFGDCLPISSSTSFYKDLVLLLAIGFLMFKQSLFGRLLPERLSAALMLLVALFSFGLEMYVLRHLPVVDCLPYRLGVNIPEGRKQPPPPPGSTAMFVYRKNGQEIEFSADKFPDDFSAATYSFVRRYDTGEIPQAPIQGLVLYSQSGTDTTESILTSNHLLVIFTEEIGGLPDQGKQEWEAIYALGSSMHVPIALVTNRAEDWSPMMADKYPATVLLSCDRTPIRTAARVNPTLYELKKGTVMGKWALADWGAAHEKILRVP